MAARTPADPGPCCAPLDTAALGAAQADELSRRLKALESTARAIAPTRVAAG